MSRVNYDCSNIFGGGFNRLRVVNRKKGQQGYTEEKTTTAFRIKISYAFLIGE